MSTMTVTPFVAPATLGRANTQKTSETDIIAKIGDVIRGSLLANQLEQIPRLLQSVVGLVKSQGGRLYLKNFWSDPKPLSLGYVGIHLKIRMPIPPVKRDSAGNLDKTNQYIVMELQIHPKQIMDGTEECAKEIAHRLYKIPGETAEETTSLDIISSSQLMYLTSMVKLLYDADELKKIANTLDLIQAATKANKKTRLVLETALLLQCENLCQGEWSERLQAIIPTDKAAVASAWFATAQRINTILNLPVIKEDDTWVNTAQSVDALYENVKQIAPYFEHLCREAVKKEPECSVNFGPGNKHMIKERASLQAKIIKYQNLHLIPERALSGEDEEHKRPFLSDVSSPGRALSSYYPRLQRQICYSISLKQEHPSFTGRQDELTHLTNTLSQKGIALLYGPAGIGKTELAITFANQHLEDYSLLWFIPCSTEEERATAYIEFASALKIPFHPGQRTEELIRRVHLKLENMEGKPWLLIYDNLSNLSEYPQRGGHILITSLAKHPEIDSIEVRLFSLSEAQQMMTQLTHEPVSPAMNELIDFCGYYPAILERVGMDIRRIPGMTIQTYLKTLSTDATLTRLPLQGRYQKTLEHAILQTTAHLPPKAVEWLQACCYLHPSSIPVAYLHRWLTFQTPNTVDSRCQSDILIALSEHAIQQLREDCLSMPTIFHKALALLKTDKKALTFQVHELLSQEAAQWNSLLKTDWGLAMKQASIWNEHAIYFSSKGEFVDLALEKQAVIFHFLGTLKEQQSEPAAALAFHQKALQLRERAGAHEEIAISLENIGSCCYRLNQRDEAAAYHQKAEAIRKQAGAEKPLDIAKGLIHRAMNCYSKGEPAEALALCTQAVQIQIQELSEKSIEVADTWFSMGQCAEQLGSVPKALEWYKKAHLSAKQSAGENHPLTKKCERHVKRFSKTAEQK